MFVQQAHTKFKRNFNQGEEKTLNTSVLQAKNMVGGRTEEEEQ